MNHSYIYLNSRDGKDDEKRVIGVVDCNSKKKEKKKKRTKFDEKYPRKSLPASPSTERVSEAFGGDSDGDGDGHSDVEVRNIQERAFQLVPEVIALDEKNLVAMVAMVIVIVMVVVKWW